MTHELISYSLPADGPFFHTWYYQDSRWEESVFFSAPTTGMDTLSTFKVCCTSLRLTVHFKFPNAFMELYITYQLINRIAGVKFGYKNLSLYLFIIISW